MIDHLDLINRLSTASRIAMPVGDKFLVCFESIFVVPNMDTCHATKTHCRRSDGQAVRQTGREFATHDIHSTDHGTAVSHNDK